MTIGWIRSDEIVDWEQVCGIGALSGSLERSRSPESGVEGKVLFRCSVRAGYALCSHDIE